MKKILVTASLLLSSLAMAGPDASDVRMRGKMKNQIYFFVDGSKMHVLYPYNYLKDGNPQKKRALEAVEVFYREQLASWAEFYLDFTGAKDADIRAILADKSMEGRKKLQKQLQKNPLEKKDPLALMERAYQMAGEQISDIGDFGTQTGNKKFIENSIAEYNKQQAYLLDNTINFRKLFEQNLDQFDQYLPWENWKDSELTRVISPDFLMMQVYGNWRQEYLDKIKAGQGGFFTRHRTFGKIIKALAAAVDEASKFRVTFVTRPWIHNSYDFNTGEFESHIPYFETGTFLWYNTSLSKKQIKDKSFWRFAIGGINGQFENVKDLNALMTGYSQNVGPLNLKVGVVAPLSLNLTDVFNVGKYLGSSEGHGIYFLGGYQKGLMYRDMVSVATPSPGTGGMNDPINPGSPNKPGPILTDNQDPNKAPKQPRYSKVGANWDAVAMFNVGATIERLGADYSGLSQQLLELLNLAPKTPKPIIGWPFNPVAPGTGQPGGPTINPGFGGFIPIEPGDNGLFYKNLNTQLAIMEPRAAAHVLESLSPEMRRNLIDVSYDYGDVPVPQEYRELEKELEQE